MKTLMNPLKKLFQRTTAPDTLQAMSPIAPRVEVEDVTQYFTELDLGALDVLQWTPAHMTRAERLLMFTLTFTLRPKRYLEIGTFKGGSALIVAAAMEASGSTAKMVCVDPRPAIAPEHWQKLEQRATLLTGFSPAVLPDAMRAAGGAFDFVLIDGDHSYEGMMRDAEGVLPFVAPGAYILFHDSFYSEVASGLDDFVTRHAGQVVDFGPMTREVTMPHEPVEAPVQWGGLRMLQVRRG